MSRGLRPSFAALAAVTVAVALPAGAAAATKPTKPVPRLVAFDSCGDLLTYARRGALRTGGTPGVPLRAGSEALVISRPASSPNKSSGAAGGEGAAAPAPQASATAGDASAPTFSTTNNQEAGVDEPDVVKTDGSLVYAVTDETLRVIDVTGAAPVLRGALKLDGYGHQLLVRGKRLLVSASEGGFRAYDMAVAGPRQASSAPSTSIAAPYPGVGKTILTEIDISDTAAPKVARAMTVDGDFVGARLNGATARVVIGSAPDPIVAGDDETFGEAVKASTTAAFIPRTVLRSKLSGRTFRRPIAKCRQVRHPRNFSGTGLLTVMTIDLDRGLFSVDRDAVMAGAQTVYGSEGSLYVASQRYSAALERGDAVPEGSKTEIHRFDASKEGLTSYRSTGEVPGFVLNQYALSEFGGRLRVATTREPLWFPNPSGGGSSQATVSASAVTVLDEVAGKLVTVGRVGDLGKGERIYAVRFVGDAGYVVTFRQVDPLYVVDLSKPTAPRVRGELKITGYSAYLHPLGDDLLLSVGQEASPQGRTQGSQVSLFDVSDPTTPKRLSQKFLGQGNSSAEFDPHAFLYWAPKKLAVLPLRTYDVEGRSSFTGAAGFNVERTAGITDAGRVEHPGVDGFPAPIDRSLVVDGKLYTLSYAGLGRSRLDTLAPETFTAFPAG